MTSSVFPDRWKVQVEEVSSGCYLTVAEASDGRRIEWHGSERSGEEILESIRDSDRQLAEKVTQSR